MSTSDVLERIDDVLADNDLEFQFENSIPCTASLAVNNFAPCERPAAWDALVVFVNAHTGAERQSVAHWCDECKTILLNTPKTFGIYWHTQNFMLWRILTLYPRS